MSIWIIEPHDPLIFRDGRPFGASPGATARSLPFPFPATIAGGVRSQAGMNEQGHFRFTTDTELKRLKKVGIRGPILVQLAAKGQGSEQWLAPAPFDALLYPVEESDKQGERTTKFVVNQLVPLTPLAKAMTDLNTGETSQQPLWLVGLPRHQSKKPGTDTPSYWYWEHFLCWLANPAKDTWKAISAHTLGIKGLVAEERVYVSMNPQTRTGRKGFLFATSGLEFTATHKTAQQEQEQQPASLAQTRQLGLAVIVNENINIDDNKSLQPQAGPGCLGSERRIVNWSPSHMEEPSCPENIKQCILKDKACRLVLLTPAYFAQGHLPGWILTTRYGVTPELKAIVNRRPHVVSGWDIANKKRKQSRRLAPAGTVLFLELHGDDKLHGDESALDESALEEWIKQTWLHCVSDDDEDTPDQPDQYRLDGFGLAVLGTWTGNTTPMQSDSEQKKVQ